MKRMLVLTFIVSLLLAGCSSLLPQAAQVESAEATPAAGGGMGMGMGMGGGMMERHHAAVPDEYASLKNPTPKDDESIVRGADLYAAQCATCHGDGGMGDGPGGQGLNPGPSPVAHSSQMMGDGYLYWRISEGGAPFETAMPAWKDALDAQSRWDLINYIRALGAGTAPMRQGMGGAAPDPDAEAAQQAEMLASAVAQGVLTQAEADTFREVHDIVDGYVKERPDLPGGMDQRQDSALAALVQDGKLTQAQAEAFKQLHQKLAESGLMH